MAGSILQAASQVSPSAKARLKGVTGQSYSGAAQGVADTRNDLGQSLSSFMGAAGEAFGQYNQYKKKQADTNVQQILRTMSPEQIQDARQKGILLAQDDPYTTAALNSKLGAMESDRIYSEGQQKIAAGHFNSRDEYTQWMSQRTQQAMGNMAKAYNIDPQDEHWKNGWAEDADIKNISIYRQVDSKVEEMAVNHGRVVNFNRVDGITKDKSITGAQRAELFANFLNNGMSEADGTIRNADMAKEILNRGLTNAAADPQGGEFLQTLGDKQMNIYGTKTTPKEFLGKEQWDVLTAQSEQSRYKNDWEFSKGFQNDLLTVQAMEDTGQAEAKLNQLEAHVYSAQPSNMATPEKQQIQQMREFLVNKRIQQAKIIRESTIKKIQASNRQIVLQDVYQKRQAGDNVSVELDQLPTNELTGKFTPEDLANFGNNEFKRIDQLPIPEEQKDAMKMKALRADSAKGPFRARMGTLIQDATQEWAMAVQTGDVSNTPRLDELQKMYRQDPVTIGLLYPDQQKLFQNMDLMQSAGFSKETLALSESKLKDLTKQEQIDREKNWTAMMNDTTDPVLSAIPKKLQSTMYKAYEANLGLTGNTDAAIKFVKDTLDKNYVSFQTDGIGGKASNNVGTVSKNALMVNPDDVNSWTTGRDIVETYKTDFVAAQPWVTPKDVSVVELDNGSIRLMTPYGDAVTITKDDLRNHYKEQLKQAEATRAAGVEDELKGINVRLDTSSGGISSYQFPATLMNFVPIK